MKKAPPALPTNAPPGTVWYGGPIDWFSISLSIISEDLVPDEISELMGCQPTRTRRKGEPIVTAKGPTTRIAKAGSWQLNMKRPETDEWDCAEAIMVLLSRLPSDVRLWEELSQKYKTDLLIGLLMSASNKGFIIPREIMKYLGDRGISAGFDVYHEPEPAKPE